MLKALWQFIEEYFEQQEEVYTPETTHDERLDSLPTSDPIFMEELHKNIPPEGLDWQPDWLDLLIDALTWVESRGDINAIGDKGIPMSKGGPAYGCLQIRGGVLSEVNALWGKKYKGTDLLGEKGAELSKLMCRAYFLSIAPQYRSYKKAVAAGIPLQEICAKSWNGGCGYFEQQSKKGFENYRRNLDHYWALVQTRLIK